jgi:hypothetical protein
MVDYTITIPGKLYDKARRIAEIGSQDVDDVILARLEESLDDNLLDLPEVEQLELHALAYLSNDTLWTIAREQMPAAKQERMQPLMDRNTLGTITSEEYHELEQLVEDGQRLMTRKAEAMKHLLNRGYKITLEALKPTDE